MADEPRSSGWLPLDDMELRGDPELAARLGDALACEGRVDRLTHGFHTYPAGLHPDSAKLMLELLPQGEVYDPFSGGGTVLVEAMVAGRSVSGSDLSPVACLVSRGRTRLWEGEKISAMRSWGRKITERARQWDELPQDPHTRSTREWYQPQVARELQGIRVGISHAPDELQDALRFCLSTILIKVSQRRSDTSQARDERHRPEGTTAILFHKKVREYGRRLEALAAAVPEGTQRPQIRNADVRRAGPEQPVAAILTSPPYPAVYDYLPLQRLRVAWLGMDDRPFRDLEIASRRSFRGDGAAPLKHWRQDMRQWMKRVDSQLAPGGQAGVVIGDGFNQGRIIDTLAGIEFAAQEAGLQVLASASGGRLDRGPQVQRREHVILVGRR